VSIVDNSEAAKTMLTVIVPSTGVGLVDIGEIWAHRELL